MKDLFASVIVVAKSLFNQSPKYMLRTDFESPSETVIDPQGLDGSLDINAPDKIVRRK